MIQRSMGLLIVLALMVCMASVVFARGGPPGEKAFASKAAVVKVTPEVATIPAMSGYDVIQNISQESRVLSNSKPYSAVTTDRGSRSTTGDERGFANCFPGCNFDRSAPRIVMLA